MQSHDYLSFYSKIFNFVEINLSKYELNDKYYYYDNEEARKLSPAKDSRSLRATAKRWYDATPDCFKISLRIPENLLYFGRHFCKEELGEFLEALAPIEEKILALTIDVPSQVTLGMGRQWLENVLATCVYHGYSCAFQFHHSSWYQDLTYNILKKYDSSLIWSDSQPYIITTTSDFIYLRSTSKEYNSLLADKVRRAISESVECIVLAFENPVSARSFRESLGIAANNSEGDDDYNIEKRKGEGAKEKNDSNTSRTQVPLPINTGVTRSMPPATPGSIPISHSELHLKARHWKGRVIFCVDLNAFYPSCEELREPALRGKPHAVIMTDQKEGDITKGVVSSCSYEARKYGIRSAMGLSNALSLYPKLILRPVDIPYYSSISAQVMLILAGYSDVLEQASIDEAFLDCTARIIGDEAPAKYANSIKLVLKEKLGLLCSIGVASTRSAAKIASDYKKPDGLTIVHPDDLKKFLEPLGVERVSGIGPKTQNTLKGMGITKLGQLANADIQKLMERFGKNGSWMWNVANGTDYEPITPREDHVSLSTEHTIETVTKDRDEILGFLNALVAELYERTKSRGYMFKTIGVKLVRTDFTIETRETSFDEYQSSLESMSSQIGYLLDRSYLSDPEKPAIRKVGLRLSHLVRKEEELQKKAQKMAIQKTLLDYF